MKISVITVNGSEYTYQMLNYARQRNLAIDTIAVINYSFARKLKIIRNMYVRRLGWLESLPIIVQRIVNEHNTKKLRDGVNKSFLRDYNLLGRNVIHSKDENDPAFIEKLNASAPDLLLLGQIGILKSNILSVPRIATINAHSGWLPEYRGNDVLYWTIYFSQYDRIGFTIHLVDNGIDTGRIFGFTPCAPVKGETIQILQERIKNNMAKALINTAINYEDRSDQTQSQERSEGRTYFVMPYCLKRNTEKKLISYLKELK